MASSGKPGFNGDLDSGQRETVEATETILPSTQASPAEDAFGPII
jgi:hypothetical protein